MIPAFDSATGALPLGIHEATWAEVAERFGSNDRRRELLAGMRRALGIMANAGCGRVYLGGTFVTTQVEPGDWDACYDPIGVVRETLPDTIREERQIGIRGQFGDEVFIGDDGDVDFPAFFQRNRAGRATGVVALDPHGAQQEEK